MVTRGRNNNLFWEERRVKYPYQAETKFGKPKPTEVPIQRVGLFLAVPMWDSFRTLWGFHTSAQRAEFIRMYKHHGAKIYDGI